MNAVIAPGNGTKQPSRDRLDEVISARLQTIRVPIQRSVKAKRAGNGTHLLLCSKNQNCSVELLVNSNGSPARGSGFIYILFRGFSNPRCLHSPVSARIAERRFSAAPARRAERGDRRAAETHPICVGPRAALSVRSATQSYALLASGSAAQSAAPRTGSSRPGNIGLFFPPLIVA